MEGIKFVNKQGGEYFVTSSGYGRLRWQDTAYVNGYYGYSVSKRNNPTRLFKDTKGRPFLRLGGKKYYPADIKDDELFEDDLKDAEVK